MAKISWFLWASLSLALLSTTAAQKPLFSTETGYDLSFDFPELNQRTLSWRALAQATGGSAPEGLENCSPVGSYIVYREATSFPDEADITGLNAVKARMRQQTINPTFRFLAQIPDSRVPTINAGQLTEVGRREMQELASRIKTRFAEFFTNPDIDLSKFDFQSINATNSIDSAVAFARGLVGTNQICETQPTPGNVTVTCTENSRLTRVVTPTSASILHDTADMDPLLRPYVTRRRCLNAVNRGKTARELQGYQRGREAMQFRDRIARKLVPQGARPFNISGAEVQLLAKICGYHLAMFNDNNTWCRLFDYEDLNVAEYERELQHYWDESYGFPLNSRVVCPLINDTMEYFERLTARGAGAGANLPFMTIKFADDNTLIRLASLLGISRDPRQLMARNYAQNRNRQFRSAKIAPFGANLALNLFRCEEAGGLFFNDQTYRVQVLLNERPINITFCQDSFCDLASFKRELLNQAGQCMVQADCNVAFGMNPDGTRRGGGRAGGGVGGAEASTTPGRLLIGLTAVIVAKLGYSGL